VSAGLTPTQVEALLDPARYTGLCRQLAERGAAMGREIAATIERLRLGDGVRMLGNVPHPVLVGRVNAGEYDVLALASTERNGEHEGIPVAVMEAMAAALPVVVTRTGSLPELVEPEFGALVPQRDPRALAAALERLLGDPEERRRAGRAGRERIRVEFETGATSRTLLGWIEGGATS